MIFTKEIRNKIFAAVAVLGAPVAAAACPLCRAQVNGGIYDQDFFLNLAFVLLPIALLTAFGVGLYRAEDFRRETKR